MNREGIGNLAVFVWWMLKLKGKLSFDALQRETTLSSVSVATAIGWLAREDKIQFEKLNGTTYYYVYHKRYY